MCQALLPKASGTGRCLAMEIMVPNAAIRNLIREDKIHQIYSTMQTGQEKYGMQTFNQSLASLYFAKQITLQTALGVQLERRRAAGHDQSRRRTVDTAVRGPAARPAADRGEAFWRSDACIRLQGQDPGRQGRLRRARRRQQGSRDGAAAPGPDPGLLRQGEGQGGRGPEAGRQRARQGPRDLRAPVLGHDRRRSAAGAVPRDPGQPAGQQDLREDPAADPHGRRGRRLAWPTRCASTPRPSTICSPT